MGKPHGRRHHGLAQGRRCLFQETHQRPRISQGSLSDEGGEEEKEKEKDEEEEKREEGPTDKRQIKWSLNVTSSRGSALCPPAVTSCPSDPRLCLEGKWRHLNADVTQSQVCDSRDSV